jgi:Protein of unknown function (DUF1588)/Protein of unknown function (DUF1592)/Protein of unknown function (DUF1595)
MSKSASIRRLVIAIVIAGTLTLGTQSRAQLSAMAPPASPAPPAASTAAITADQQYEKSDPELYATARQYFPSDAAGVPAKRIFRLTRDQLDATVAALLPDYAIPSVKSVVARDALQTNYEYAELLSISGANSSGLTSWISDIAARVRKNPAGVINCAANGNTTECLTEGAKAFIIKAFRGDVSDDRLAEFAKFYLASAKSVGLNQAAADLVEIVLNSPNFLFRKEVEVNRSNRLSPAQLLQAVTYTIADAPPEKLKLLSQNAGQYLRSGPEAAVTISTIMASPSAREKLMRFFKAWLEIKEPGEFTISAKVYPEFNAKLEASMLDETTQFLRAQLAKPSPSLKDITQSAQAFASTGTGSAKLVNVDSTQRLGIFSQPALIASHSGPTDTRPIKRGVFWVRKVMCMEMEPTPAGLDAKLIDIAGATERQRIEQSTKGPDCAGCHKAINPFAFFQENYDALGRWRTKDHGIDIDSSIMIDFLDEEPQKTTGPVAALKLLTSSQMFKQCFVRQLFRFYMGRTEEPGDDPLLRRIFFEFAYKDNQDIVKAVQMLTSSDRIVRRQ